MNSIAAERRQRQRAEDREMIQRIHAKAKDLADYYRYLTTKPKPQQEMTHDDRDCRTEDGQRSDAAA